ncbi:MAG: excinuclease ABC subunit C, partial [Planctomycetes bacterium]|nr:excinuclease ABC subunit C [Planctomycetota bacterium]
RALEELGLQDDVRVCGLAKSRLRGVGDARRESGERIFVPEREQPIALAPDAPETLLVAALRDEAHRFAITYHRKQRGRIASELDDVPGVGPARRRALLRHFGSLAALRRASREELAQSPLPAAVAEAVWHRLQAGGGGEEARRD